MSDFNHEHFAARLLAIRKAMQLQQAEISAVLDCTNGAYSLYERGKRQPGLLTLFNIADQFGVSLDYLFGCFVPLPDISIFSERLRQILEENQGKPLSRLLSAKGYNPATEPLLLSGACLPHAKLLADIARYYNCSTDYLTGLSDTPNVPRLDLLHGVSSRDRLSALPAEVRADVEHYMEYRLSVYQQEHKGKRA